MQIRLPVLEDVTHRVHDKALSVGSRPLMANVLVRHVRPLRKHRGVKEEYRRWQFMIDGERPIEHHYYRAGLKLWNPKNGWYFRWNWQ